MKRTIAGLVAAAAAVAAPYAAAQSQDIGFYAGGAFGQVKAKDWCSTDGAPGGAALLSCDDKDTAWKILGGYQFHRNFAAEIQYMDLGSVSGSVNLPPFGTVGVSADNTQFAASILGILPIGSSGFSVFGKVGIERIDQKQHASVAGVSGAGNGSDSGALIGLGVKYAIGRNLRLRGEWEHGDTLNTDIVTVGAEWRF
jgi:OOP family OmpA-OmpF porin